MGKYGRLTGGFDEFQQFRFKLVLMNFGESVARAGINDELAFVNDSIEAVVSLKQHCNVVSKRAIQRFNTTWQRYCAPALGEPEMPLCTMRT